MADHEIRIIGKDTVIPKLKPFEWDLVVHGRPFFVAHVPGFVHSIKGWGEPIDLWAWPRDEEVQGAVGCAVNRHESHGYMQRVFRKVGSLYPAS